VITSIAPRDMKILENLQLMAEDSVPVKHAKFAACIAVRGKIMAFGHNSLRTHPFQMRFGKNEQSPFWHAETNCVFNALKRMHVEDLARASLYVVRVKRPYERSKEWVLGNARPCKGCRSCIFTFGIPTVFYSNEHNGFTCDSGDDRLNTNL
jgi:tRNA(Arg) A34 adenosine deaminase TadA